MMRDRFNYNTVTVISKSISILFILVLLANLLSFVISLRVVPEPYRLHYEGYIIYKVLNLDALYTSIQDHPYVLTVYTPGYYVISNIVTRITGDVFVATRGVSVVAALGITAITFLIVRTETNAKYVSLVSLSSLLFILNELTRRWIFQANVDLLGLFFGISTIYWYITRDGRSELIGVIALSLLTLYTKQALVAFPGAIFLAYMYNREYRRGTIYATVLTVSGLSILFVLNVVTNGEFWFHTVTASSVMSYEISSMVMINYRQVFKPNVAIIMGGLAALVISHKRIPNVLIIYSILGFASLLAVGKEGTVGNFFLIPLLGLVPSIGILFASTTASTEILPSYDSVTVDFKTFVLVSLILIGQMGSDIGAPHSHMDGAERMDQIVEQSDGLLLSEDMVVSAKYDRPIIYQASAMATMNRTGYWDSAPVDRLIHDREFTYVILLSKADTRQADRFTARQLDLITRCYQIDETPGTYYIYTPRSSCAEPDQAMR